MKHSWALYGMALVDSYRQEVSKKNVECNKGKVILKIYKTT